jgi:hypothetical protein
MKDRSATELPTWTIPSTDRELASRTKLRIDRQLPKCAACRTAREEPILDKEMSVNADAKREKFRTAKELPR